MSKKSLHKRRQNSNCVCLFIKRALMWRNASHAIKKDKFQTPLPGYLSTFFSVLGDNNILLHCKLRKWGVTRVIIFATCNATFVALQVAGKIASCNMTLMHSVRRKLKLFPNTRRNLTRTISVDCKTRSELFMHTASEKNRSSTFRCGVQNLVAILYADRKIAEESYLRA